MKYIPQYLKKKIKKMEPFEQLILELIITVRNEDKDKVNSFLQTWKTHWTLKDKKFTPIYAENLQFLINRTGWLVNHI